MRWDSQCIPCYRMSVIFQIVCLATSRTILKHRINQFSTKWFWNHVGMVKNQSPSAYRECFNATLHYLQCINKLDTTVLRWESNILANCRWKYRCVLKYANVLGFYFISSFVIQVTVNIVLVKTGITGIEPCDPPFYDDWNFFLTNHIYFT